MIDIEPTKENFEIVKELGTKWLMGLATLNAAMVVYVLSNHKESLTVYIAVALVFFAFGTMAALLCGWNVYELFLRYSSVTNLENKYNCIVKSQNGETVCSVRAVLENDRQEEIKKNKIQINQLPIRFLSLPVFRTLPRRSERKRRNRLNATGT